MNQTSQESSAPNASVNSDTAESIEPKDIIVNAQYIKDMSIKIPFAPAIFTNMPETPYITITVDVKAHQLPKHPSSFEVNTIIGCISTTEPRSEETENYTIIYDIQLQYAAIVTLPTLKAANLEDILMVQTPDLLFPEIRNIIINTTRLSNLPPLLLQRINFADLWNEKKNSVTKK